MTPESSAKVLGAASAVGDSTLMNAVRPAQPSCPHHRALTIHIHGNQVNLKLARQRRPRSALNSILSIDAGNVSGMLTGGYRLEATTNSLKVKRGAPSPRYSASADQILLLLLLLQVHVSQPRGIASAIPITTETIDLGLAADDSLLSLGLISRTIEVMRVLLPTAAACLCA